MKWCFPYTYTYTQEINSRYSKVHGALLSVDGRLVRVYEKCVDEKLRKKAGNIQKYMKRAKYSVSCNTI